MTNLSGDHSEASSANRYLLLTTLYFAQGVPFGFFTQALPTLMRERAYSLQLIGLSSLLALPWALKWLWAPCSIARTMSVGGVDVHGSSPCSSALR